MNLLGMRMIFFTLVNVFFAHFFGKEIYVGDESYYTLNKLKNLKKFTIELADNGNNFNGDKFMTFTVKSFINLI